MLLLQTVFLFLLCFILLKFYEKLKNETALFFPALTMGIILAGLRWGGVLEPRVDLLLVDMVIGILFAFLYVQLRRRFARFLRPHELKRSSAALFQIQIKMFSRFCGRG